MKISHSKIAKEKLSKMIDAGVEFFTLYDVIEYNTPIRDVKGIQSALLDMLKTGELDYVMEGEQHKRVYPDPSIIPHYVTSPIKLKQYTWANWGLPDKSRSKARAKKRHLESKKQFDPDSPWSYVWPELFSLPEYVTKSKRTNLIHH